MAAKKKVAKKVVKKAAPAAKKTKKAVRGKGKDAGKAKLSLKKTTPAQRPPRIGQVVLFTEGEGRKMKFGIGFAESAVGEIVNILVGKEPHSRIVHVHRSNTYKPLATEKSLHDFLCESIRIAFEAGFGSGFKAGEHSALGKTHSAAEKALEAVDAQPAVHPSNDPDNDIAIANLKKAEAVLNNADDLSILYAAFAKKPSSQQVVERAEDVVNDNSKAPTIGDVVAGHVAVGEGLYEVRDDGVLAFVREIHETPEELTEEQKLAVVEEVQKAPLL